VVFGKFVLPNRGEEEKAGDDIDFSKIYYSANGLSELEVPPDYKPDKTLEQMAVRSNYLVSVVAVSEREKGQKIGKKDKKSLHPQGTWSSLPIPTLQLQEYKRT
jgi:hypothetical protein